VRGGRAIGVNGELEARHASPLTACIGVGPSGAPLLGCGGCNVCETVLPASNGASVMRRAVPRQSSDGPLLSSASGLSATVGAPSVHAASTAGRSNGSFGAPHAALASKHSEDPRPAAVGLLADCGGSEVRASSLCTPQADEAAAAASVAAAVAAATAACSHDATPQAGGCKGPCHLGTPPAPQPSCSWLFSTPNPPLNSAPSLSARRALRLASSWAYLQQQAAIIDTGFKGRQRTLPAVSCGCRFYRQCKHMNTVN
jgi:hypothetical protein